MIDLGIVRFGMVVVTSSYVLGMVNGGGMLPAKKSVGGALFLLSPLLVAINYGAGAILGFGYLNLLGFGIYFTIFVLACLPTRFDLARIVKEGSIIRWSIRSNGSSSSNGGKIKERWETGPFILDAELLPPIP
jgi:hypothetical protein